MPIASRTGESIAMSWWRRCAVFTLLLFGLSVAVPAQVVQPGGSFPLSWLTDLFTLRTAWAAVTGLPVQQRRDPGHGGYTSAAATTANGGHGEAQEIAPGGLDGYLPHDASDGTTKTDPAQVGYVAKTSKRQSGKSKAGMSQYANADGSLTQVYSAGRSNYKATDGTWQPIDTTLVKSGSRWSMKANSLDVSLGAVEEEPVTVPSAAPSAPVEELRDPLVSMTIPSGGSVGYDLQGAATVTPTVDGTVATYPKILPGTDLELQTFTNGVKETLVLASPAAGNEWVFPLRLTGLTPRMAKDGSVELVDADGAVKASFPHGSMKDAKFDEQSGEMTHSSKVEMSLIQVDGAPALKVVADRAWLDDPARVYPIRVDPTVTTGDTGDVYVDNDSDTTSSDQNGDNLPVGTYNSGTTKARSFIHFGDFSTSGVTGGRVTAASLKLYLTWQYACSVDRAFYVHTAAESWTVANLSTVAYPGADVSTDPIGSLTVTDPGTACTNTGADRSIGKWVTVPLSVATFNDWSSGGSNLGLALLSSVTDSYAWKRFTSANYSSGDYKPQLSLTYTANVLPQVDTRYPGNNAIVETLTPQLATRAHDPDAYPAKGLTYNYTVYNSAGTALVSSGAVTTQGWQVPAGKLAWNSTYYYTVKIGDKVGTTAESGAYAFTTPVPQPRLTSDLAQNPGAGFDPNNGNYTTSASDAQVTGVGPALEISRSYNSLDTRRTGAFGQGWSSILDVKATERYDTTGAVQTVVVTYPNGSEVAFGRNTDGTFTAPSGRYAVFTKQTTGYTLTDKDATQYVFGRDATGGVYKVTQIIDANGRALTFAYDATTGLIATMTNASGRTLTLTWTGTHVATVTTDAPTAGGTGYTWTYAYGTYDRLTTVCPPGTTTDCTVYNWANWNNQYANAVLNLNPYSYWRLNDASGTSAVSSVLTNAGTDNGTYKNVTLGGASGLPDSGATTAAFTGSASYVQLPGKLVADGSYQTVSMWFKTSTAGGVLFSYSAGAITAGTTASNYTPALYVDKNGYLRGEFWQGSASPIKSKSTVIDGAWHHVVLSGAGATQTLYLDGAAQGSLAGTISLYQTGGSAYEYVGAGFVGNSWPDHASTGVSPAVATYFTGSIADVGFFTKALTSTDVSGIYSVAKNSSSAIRYIKSPAGRIQSQVAVSNVTGQVTSVTDENNGVWTMGTPTIAGSSDVYAASVLGAKPTNYWRLGETDTDTTDAVNEVAGDTATYSGVTLGATGPFSDATAITLDGTAGNVALPSGVAPAGANSVSVWFNTTATGKVLLGSQAGALGETTAPGLPTLWVSSDGKLRALAPSTTPTGPLRSAYAGKCVDNASNLTTNNNPIRIYDCNNSAAQNMTLLANGSIQVSGKCLDVPNAATANNTLIQLYTCNASAAQLWEPYNGGFRNPNSGKCLDLPNGTTTNGTQLQLYTCNSSNPQKWTLSLSSTAVVNDGKWHNAILTSSGTAQTLYIDGVKASASTGTVAFAPGAQPYAYLGAGLTGTGWSGLTAATTSYFSGKIAEAAFYPSELTADQVTAQLEASKQTVAVAVTTVDTTVKTITMPVKNVTVTDPGGKTISYAYDLLNNRQVAETDALGNVTKYGYDIGGYSSLVYDPNGVRTQTVQDERGNTIQQITCQDQSANLCASTYFGYYLNTASPVDPRNDVMITSRDGRSSSATDTTYLTTYNYDAKGNPLGTTDPLGRTTSTLFTDGTTIAGYDGGYAPAGLPYRIVNAGGGVQGIAYYANGDLAKTMSPSGEVSVYTYDKLGRKLTETITTGTFPGGRTSTFTYDAQGLVLTETDPPVTNRVTGAVHTAVTTNTYDADGNMTSQTTADSTGGDVARTQTVTFNSLGQKDSQTDAVGKSTNFTYNAYGQVILETDSDGGSTAYDVDAEGNVLSETMKGWTGDPNNPSTASDLVTETNVYDPDGRLASTTDAMGRTTSYTYTDNDLTAKVTITDGTSTYVQEQNSYDYDGNLTTQLTNNGKTKTVFAYDAAGRQTTTTVDPSGVNRVTTNVYNVTDNVITTTQAVGTGSTLSATDYRYDAEGRITAETAYNSDPATTPVARWKLNETSGTRAADSAGNSPGTTSDVTWSTAAPTGLSGSATFTGSGTSKVLTDGPVVDTTRAYTTSTWVKLTSKAADGYVLAQPGANGNSTFKLAYLASTDKWQAEGTVRLADGSSGWWSAASAAGLPALNAWTHLAVVVDPTAGTVKLYVNNALVATSTVGVNAFNNQATGQLNIGNQYGASGFTGSIADVQFFQRALSATQVSAIYGNTQPTAAKVSRTSSTLDEGGLVTRSFDALGNATDVTYDVAERPVITTAPAVTAETFTGQTVARPVSYAGYDTFGDQTESVDGNGNRSTYLYDRAGRAYETHGATYTTPAGATINPVSTTTFDSLGQTVSSTDERGNTTGYTYDQLGRLAKTVAPNGATTTVTYDLAGEPLTVTGPTGAVTAMTYDYLGRKLTSTEAVRQTGQSLTTTYGYDDAGLLASMKTPAGVTESYTYNSVGEQVTVKDGAGQTSTTEYDGLGRPTGQIAPDSVYSTTTYDMLGQTTASATYASKTSTTALTSSSQTYDSAGNVLTSTDGRGTTTSFTYDPTGMPLTESQPTASGAAITTSFGYDLLGNQTRFTDGRNNAFWTTYNSWNLAESTIEPVTSQYVSTADRSYTITYDAAGQAVKQTSPGGVEQTYSYDNMGQLTSQAGTGAAAATSTRSFSYDLGGRVTTFSSPSGDNTVTYDDRNLPTAISGPSGNSSFSYTSDGLMASRTDSAGTTAYTYDGADRLSTLKNTTAGTDLSYAYDTTSAISTITYGSGDYRSFTYDKLHRVTADELKTSAGASVAKVAYTWDANSNETSKTTTNFGGSATITNTYGYDLADRLTSWNNGTTTIGYTYDASGNRTGNGSTTYTYDQRNRLVTDSAGVSYSYTPRGTLTSVVGPSAAYTTTSDAFDEVITQSYGSGTETYGYDALGRALQTGFSYTGTGNDLATDDSGATYVRDPGADVVGTASGSNTRLVWTDLHDDIVGQFTSTGTALSGSTVYDPLGTVKATGGMLGSLGYQSEYTESSTGRTNMAARWYNTGTGQFDSRDTQSNSPIPDSVSANRYQYGDANPLTVTDPSGHGWWSKVTSAVSRVTSTVSSYASQATSYASSYASYAYHSVSSSYYSAKAKVLSKVAHVAKRVGWKSLAKKADSGRKKAAKKSREQHRRATKAHKEAQRKGHALKQRVVRAAKKAVKVVKDAKKKTVAFVKKHKKEIIAIAATVATVVAVATLGPVGGIVAGIAISVLKDAASGDIHNLSDLGGSLASAAFTGVLGAATGGLGGAIGGKLAGMAACKLGAGLLGKAVSGAIGGGVSDGFADAAEQLATTGSIDWKQTRNAAATGALIGAVTGGAAKCHSFDPSTEVVMADGTTKPIAEVELGDKVLATDPATGDTEGKPVSVLHHHQDTDFADVTVRDDKTGKTTTVESTANHPFWNATTGEWTEAKDLKAGDKLRNADGESTQTVAAIKLWTGLKWMDDLTVNDIHTYYVRTGSSQVLVHNCGGSKNAPSGQPHSKKCTCDTGGNPRIVRNTGGIRGDRATRTQDYGLQFDIMDANPDWKHIAGGTKKQKRVYSADRKKYKQPDLIFENEMGEKIYYQTADVNPDGSFTDREIENSQWLAEHGEGQVIMIPKV
ncbi:LamG-like jellyroll fold domain-containing protein [Actinoplanes sp. NPDC051851]|uniref:LamG-like jellyroll fold domain-containing protein n=1 Tax=Actinoplanes sp. NPDC051851 TaxID=3154753 RepID=UPI00343C59ED